MSQNTQRPLPTPTTDTRPYWDAAKEERLLIQRCTGCGEPQFYPRGFCVSCLGDDLEWIEASGRGSVYTFTPLLCVTFRATRPWQIRLRMRWR